MPEVPAPVTVKNETLDVKIVGPVPPPAEVRRPSTTTDEQDRTTAGQRETSWLWETTQRQIALCVIVGTIIIDGLAILIPLITGRDLSTSVALTLGFVNSLATGVTSFYFSRSNHTKVGGVGDTAGKER